MNDLQIINSSVPVLWQTERIKMPQQFQRKYSIIIAMLTEFTDMHCGLGDSI